MAEHKQSKDAGGDDLIRSTLVSKLKRHLAKSKASLGSGSEVPENLNTLSLPELVEVMNRLGMHIEIFSGE